jgi:hypothetical protein
VRIFISPFHPVEEVAVPSWAQIVGGLEISSGERSNQAFNPHLGKTLV